MTLRKGHGNGAGQPRIEVLPADELPAGIPCDARSEHPGDRGEHGKFAPGNSLARVGGTRRQGITRLAARLSIGNLTADPAFQPYLRSAKCFRRAQCAAIARDVGAGVCGPAPSSIVASAALQLAASRYLFDLATAGDPALFHVASQLANASRQNLLAAHELAAREAKSRVETEGDVWDRERRDFQASLATLPSGASVDSPLGNDPADAADALDVNVGAARGHDR